MHGFALNVNNEMEGFKNIIPCGISDPKYSVTTMAKVIKNKINKQNFKQNKK